MAFFDKGYEVPNPESGYLKLEIGANRFRILSKPIIGYEFWTEGDEGGRKPVRRKMDEVISPDELEEGERPKHFWAMIVWNYEIEMVQILQLTQATIQRAIKAYVDNTKWGDPFGYDITITRKGEGLETSYQVTVDPKEKLEKVIKEQMVVVEKINLDALYSGDDPFERVGGLSEEDEKEILKDV